VGCWVALPVAVELHVLTDRVLRLAAVAC